MTLTEKTIAIVGKMKNGKRYYITDVVAELDTKVGYVAAVLFNLERKGLISLWPLDNPQERAGHVEITTPAGLPRHIIYKG